MTLGDELRGLRTALRLTQHAAAKKAATNNAEISRCEHGHHNPKIGYVKWLLAQADAEKVPTEAYPLLLRYAQGPAQSDRDALVSFLGEATKDMAIDLAYTRLSMSAQAQQALSDLPVDARFVRHEANEQTAPIRALLPHFIPENDLTSALRVGDLLSAHSLDARLIREEEVHRQGRTAPLFAFGINSSHFCDFLLTKEGDPEEAAPLVTGLFRIVLDPAGATGEAVVVDGQDRRWVSTRSTTLGLVVRVTPSPLEQPGVKWFLCAGLGAAGTVAAARYLAENWRRISAEVGEDDFVLLLQSATSSGGAGRQVHLHRRPLPATA